MVNPTIEFRILSSCMEGLLSVFFPPMTDTNMPCIDHVLRTVPNNFELDFRMTEGEMNMLMNNGYFAQPRILASETMHFDIVGFSRPQGLLISLSICFFRRKWQALLF